MFRFMLAVVILAPSVAMGQASPASASKDGGPAVGQFENDCSYLYPRAAAKTGAQGATIVSVHITADGAVQHPQLAETSGNADLDKAALTCLTGARMRPLTRGGAPIDVDTQVKVVWQRSFFSDAPIGKTQNMCRPFYPPLAIRLDHEGNTLLSFVVAENGTVKNIKVAESSGHDELDQAAIACVSGYQFRPVTQNGRPVAIDSTMRFTWRLR